MWIPSTFSTCHPGPSETWWPPGGGPGARLDYAILPNSWSVADGGSAVFFTALDWGQSNIDHCALRTWATFHSVSRHSHRAGRPAFDRETMLSVQGKDTLKTIFASVPPQPWDLNVHEHYARVQDYLVRSLSTAFPPVRGRCRSSHFSAQTWQIRQRRIWLRRRITRLGATITQFNLRCAVYGWALRLRFEVALVVYSLVRRGRDLRPLVSFIGDLRETKQALRRHIRLDMSSRISHAAQEAPCTSTGNVVSRLQCLLGPSSRKSRPPKGLPGLRLKDGNAAQDPADVEKAWVEHFSSIEAGVTKDPQSLANSCIAAQLKRDLSDLVIAPDELPSCSDLEKAFRCTMLHRAFGIDGVPAEALHTVPGPAARALYAVILKCAMRVEEPLHFKGGSLYAVWKGKSSPAVCSSYRGILVSSTIGKAYHSLLRKKNVPTLEAVASPLQVGGLPKRPVTLAAHVVRLHQAWCISEDTSHAVIFLDLREAFYRIVRPKVTGFQGSEDDIQAVLRAVDLPPGLSHELHSHLRDSSLFRDAGASPWLDAVTCEALQHTWFRFEHGQLLTETGIGTRPGDNLADLIFSYVFAEVLKRTREVVDEAVGIDRIPWHPDMLNSPWPPTQPAEHTLPLLDCTWMDDSALMVRSRSADALADKLSVTAGALLDGCLGRALLPNLDKGKTEAIVSLRGAGSRKERQIHQTGALIREIRHRVALAWVAFTKRRKHIFASPCVAWKDKTNLYESLVLSVPLYGAGTWRTLESPESQCLSSAYHQMVYAMMRPAYKADAGLGRWPLLDFQRWRPYFTWPDFDTCNPVLLLAHGNSGPLLMPRRAGWRVCGTLSAGFTVLSAQAMGLLLSAPSGLYGAPTCNPALTHGNGYCDKRKLELSVVKPGQPVLATTGGYWP
ncbi:unnamed protein product, partial [Symbiodinium sp. CCMP2456]